MTQEKLERICERIYEFTRDQLSDTMNHPGEMSMDDINTTANRVQATLQHDLKPFVRVGSF